MSALPLGWMDLDPLFLFEDDDQVVLDCVVIDVRTFVGRDVPRPAPGEPIAFTLRWTGCFDAGSDLVDWFRDGASVSVLNDEDGCLMVLSHRDRVVALELDVQ